jgi:hypothetical protein
MIKLLQSYEKLRTEQTMIEQAKKNLAPSFRNEQKGLMFMEAELKLEISSDENYSAQEFTKIDEDLLDIQKKLLKVEEVLAFLGECNE